MRAIRLILAFALACAGATHAKGPQPIEITREYVAEKGMPWVIRVWNTDIPREEEWAFSVGIELQAGETKKDAVGKLEMRDEAGNLLMGAELSPTNSGDRYVEYQFNVNKSYHPRFCFWFCPSPRRPDSPVYFLRLDRLRSWGADTEEYRSWVKEKTEEPLRK